MLLFVYNLVFEIRSALLSSSSFGTFFSDKKQPAFKTVQLEKVQELTQCTITLNSERLYLLDSVGKLSCLNLKDSSLSTLPTCKLQYFHPDSTQTSIKVVVL